MLYWVLYLLLSISYATLIGKKIWNFLVIVSMGRDIIGFGFCYSSFNFLYKWKNCELINRRKGQQVVLHYNLGVLKYATKRDMVGGNSKKNVTSIIKKNIPLYICLSCDVKFWTSPCNSVLSPSSSICHFQKMFTQY